MYISKTILAKTESGVKVALLFFYWCVYFVDSNSLNMLSWWDADRYTILKAIDKCLKKETTITVLLTLAIEHSTR